MTGNHFSFPSILKHGTSAMWQWPALCLGRFKTYCWGGSPWYLVGPTACVLEKETNLLLLSCIERVSSAFQPSA